MSKFDDWPGVGPIPDPEPEGFRDEQIKKEEERQRKVREDQEKRNREATDFYTGAEASTPGGAQVSKSTSASTKKTSS
jgi:hypothetical protein